MTGSLPEACQRWRNRRHTWRRVSEGGFDQSRYETFLIEDDNPAKDFVTAHHYSGSYPSAGIRCGYRDKATGELSGVAVLSRPSNDKVLTGPLPDLEPSVSSWELGRLVLLDSVPANAESHFIAGVFRSGQVRIDAEPQPYPKWTAA